VVHTPFCFGGTLLNIRKKLRFALLLVLFTIYSFGAATHLYLVWGWCKLTRVRRSLKRRRCAFVNVWWGHQYFRLFCWCLGIRSEFRLPDGLDGLPSGTPFLVIVNHQSHTDSLAIASYLRRMGIYDGRWVMKRQLRHGSLHIGHSCIAMECAFVGRKGDPKDQLAVRTAAKAVLEDRACITIYPEGHRFSSIRKKDDYVHLMVPRTGGFNALLDELPDYHVLSVTLNWGGLKQGRTKFERSSFCAGSFKIEAQIIPPHIARQPDWLMREWERKDARLGKISKAA